MLNFRPLASMVWGLGGGGDRRKDRHHSVFARNRNEISNSSLRFALGGINQNEVGDIRNYIIIALKKE